MTSPSATHVRRERFRRPAALVTVAVTVTGLVVAGATLAAGSGGGGGCGRTLRVAAAPAVAPAVRSLAPALRDADGPCVSVVVTSVAPQAVVTDLRDGRIRPPDVWIPDSSLWLTRAGTDRVASVQNAPSLASSPLVLAVSRRTAAGLRAHARPRLSDVVTATLAGTPFRLELSDQRLSPERVGAVGALSRATASRPDARAALASLLRTVHTSAATTTTPLAALTGSRPVAVPVSEQALVAAHRPDVVAIYPGTVTFDYPFAVLTREGDTARLAHRLLTLLGSRSGRNALEAAGLRDASGAAGPSVAASTALDASTPRPPHLLTPASLRLAERTLEAVNRQARLLAVLDVSGSMAWPMAGRGTAGPSRLRLAVDAARQGMSYYPDTTEVGVWLFPGRRPGQGVQPVAPVATLGSARAPLVSRLASITPVPGGATPLYAATLKAVRELGRGWDPGKVNAVVLLSDGHDTGGGPGLGELLRTLRRSRASSQPVPVITIALGEESDAATLAKISEASGGSSYRAGDGTTIRQVFLDALGQRVCRPDCGGAR